LQTGPLSGLVEQSLEASEGIGNGLSFLRRAPVVLGQDALPVLYFGLRRLNSCPYLRAIGFEQSRFVRFVPAICGSHVKTLECSFSVPGENSRLKMMPFRETEMWSILTREGENEMF
jgi:hypothetical protein